jgi:hypothetical protein
MRPFASLAALAALASTQTIDPAAACGPAPRPRVLDVSKHLVFVHDGIVPAGWHTFVVLDELAPDDAAWTLLSPQSYDPTKIAEAPALDSPISFTLFGSSGVRVVSAVRRVYLMSAWKFDYKGHVALEVDAGRDSFMFAIAGVHADMPWHAVVPRTDVGDAAAWLDGQHVPARKNLHVAAIANTDLEIISFQPDAYDDQPRFAIRRGDANLGVHRRSVRAMIEFYDRRYLVLDDRSTIWL